METISLNNQEIQLGPELGGGIGGRLSDGGSFEERETKPAIDSTATIKDEQEEEMVEEVVVLENRDASGGGGLEMPKPLEGLSEIGPPPFLKKTYEMVEDQETDTIVSWSVNFDSFVVWDPHKFGTHLLPKYFKHSNFSSFVRQLNTYGFRKVHLDRWEFANSGFQRGKKHLLKTIKRRAHGGNTHTRLQLERETELEKLKKDQEAMEVEINDLKQQQQKSDKYLATMEDRVKCVEWKQREFVMLIAKAMKRTPFFQQLIQNYKQKKDLGSGEMLKKRRLDSSESLDSPFLEKGMTQNADQCHEDNMVAVKLEADSFLCSPPTGLGSSFMQDTNSSLTSETSSVDLLSSGNYIMWEKLMEDDVICEDNEEEEALGDNKSKFVHELENLIAKPINTWGNFTTNVGEIACPIGQ